MDWLEIPFLLLCIPLALAVFLGADVLGAVENLGEITQRGKAQQLSNLGHGKIRFGQQVLAFVDASGDHIVDGGEAVFLFEGMGEIEFIHVSFFGQLLQRQRFLEMQVNISTDSSTLPVGRNCL